MIKISFLKIQSLFPSGSFLIAVVVFLFANFSHASQDGVVTSKKAIVYSDLEMTSPVGFVKKGQIIKVGEIARNKGQVYPIIISGKIAYIKVTDISVQRESMDSKKLVAERFKENTKDTEDSKYSLSYLDYSTQMKLPKDNGNLQDKDSLTFTGVSVKGEKTIKHHWDMQVLFNYMVGTEGVEKFKIFELGGGAGFRLFDYKRFIFEWETQAMAIPYSSYALKNGSNNREEFRVNGYGYTVGTGLSAATRFGRHWGVEASAGMYYTRITGFRVPKPYQVIEPAFYGTRISIGANYHY